MRHCIILPGNWMTGRKTNLFQESWCMSFAPLLYLNVFPEIWWTDD